MNLNMQTSSEPNIQQQLSSVESDPDYNITLTAENLSGMRQVIVQSMEVDSTALNVNDSAASSDYFSDSSQQRPNFYIEPTNSCSSGCLGLGSGSGINAMGTIHQSIQPNCCNVNGNCSITQSSINTQCCNVTPNVTTLGGVHSAIGTKHVFTVEPTKNDYNQCNNNRKMSFIPNAKPQSCVVQNTSQSQMHQQIQHPNDSTIHGLMSGMACNNISNHCCCSDTVHQQQNFFMGHSAQMISPPGSKNNLITDNRSEQELIFMGSPPMRSSIAQSDGQLDNSNFSYKGNIRELNNYNNDDNMRNSMSQTMSKSQSYPYVVQAVIMNQQMQQQEFMLSQQNFYQQDPQTINFQTTNMCSKNIQQQQIFTFPAQQQQQQFQHQDFLFNNQNS